MALNLANYGVVQGNLTRDPKVFENQDGSKKICFTIACRDNFTRKDGTVDAQFVNLEAFVNAGKPLGAFEFLKKGMHVTMAYTVVTEQFEKDGDTVYKQVLRVYNNEVVLPTKTNA